ncbi:MAG: DUF2062 domain-containing protein [Phycisphaerae bacterium]|nr:DUF2062 domain-containing protein [Phycisphaerae bacterium]
MPHRYLWRKTRDVIVYRILGVKDSPHRIALGVAIAFFVAWTPTIGFQMVIAIALATLLGGNRAVTIPIVWLTNPVTAVPLYYTNWCVGHAIRRGTLEFDPTVRETLANLVASKGSFLSNLSNLFELSFWRELVWLIARCGVDLWIGSVIVGLVLAVISYPTCRWAVRAYRRARHHEENPEAAEAERKTSSEAAPNERIDPVKSKLTG